MAKKYLSLERLTEYDALIKAEILEGDDAVKSYVNGELAKKANATHSHDDLYYTEAEIDQKIEGVNTSITNITSGSTTVKKAEEATHATSADAATSATDAEKLGGQLPSYYAKASDIPTGALASKDIVSESDLDTALAEKVNAASEGNHSHLNKGVLDGITAEKVSAWDTSLDSAKEYTNTKTEGLASTTVVDNKISAHNTSTEVHSDIRATLKEVKDDVDAFFKDATISESAKDTLKEIQDYITSDASAAAEMTASIANKADKDHDHKLVDITDVTATATELNYMSGVTSNVQAQLDAKDASLSSHTSSDIHITSTERTNWDAAKTHADSDHAPSNAQANVIESIKVNGTAQTISNKSVNITVPTTTEELTNDSGFLVASDIANKADKATTLAGYGITDAYTKTEVDAKTVVDSALSSTSTNPVQNKAVNSAIVTAIDAITANTNSITAHNTRISNLETKVGDGFEEITSAEISALFAN